MSLLWALIAAVRILLTWGLTSGGLSPELVSILTLLFIPIVLMLECLILVRAVKEFRSKSTAPRKGWDALELHPGKIGIRSMQLSSGCSFSLSHSGYGIPGWYLRRRYRTSLAAQ